MHKLSAAIISVMAFGLTANADETFDACLAANMADESATSQFSEDEIKEVCTCVQSAAADDEPLQANLAAVWPLPSAAERTAALSEEDIAKIAHCVPSTE